jgi:hypothetical protein
MKASPRLVALVVRLAAILSLLDALTLPLAQAQVSFLQPLAIPSGTPTAYADFNRDGKLDIASPQFAGGPGVLLLGNGDGTFKVPINLSVSGNLIATADFNSDGNPDLLIASAQPTVLNILLGNGDGTFQQVKNTNVGTSFSVIAVADVDGDSKPDVLGLVAGGQVFVFLGNGDGTFKAGVLYSAGASPTQMLIGDFNEDGKLDLAAAGSGSPGEIVETAASSLPSFLKSATTKPLTSEPAK